MLELDRITFDPTVMGGTRVHPWHADNSLSDHKPGRQRDDRP